ncbi:hypothetical protein L2649_08505 [Thermoactinomyces vulgaris]|uniref:hypothetical protein n=1 Tax=Thermoactinomyces vulgaris TaxID=2026 RepID=UPI001586B3D0|nr:hypothetical protein [Thermoactinomyces vulgaris]MCF6135211.1 hypothetical protein [Thermoactinomyces vulgaris]
MVIYCQQQKNVEIIINELIEYVKKQNWELVTGVVENLNSSDGLFEIINMIHEVDAILIYKKNITDEFNLQLLSELARQEKIEIIDFIRTNKSK